jgi:hypothetical protein
MTFRHGDLEKGIPGRPPRRPYWLRRAPAAQAGRTAPGGERGEARSIQP